MILFILGCLVITAICALLLWLLVFNPSSRKLVLTNGESGVLRLDKVRAVVAPQWLTATPGCLWLNGDIYWQDRPMHKHPEPSKMGLPIMIFHSGDVKDAYWIESYKPSGKRYHYKLTMSYSVKPIPTLTSKLERQYFINRINP